MGRARLGLGVAAGMRQAPGLCSVIAPGPLSG